MRGQAFLTFPSIELALHALVCYSQEIGFTVFTCLLKNDVIIFKMIMFSGFLAFCISLFSLVINFLQIQ